MRVEELFQKGIEEFNARSFFEAHDTWEAVWMETAGGERFFYQGLIQTAVAFYHLTNNNFKGACSQFGKAIAKLERYVPAHHGIDIQELVDRIRTCLNDAELLKEGKGQPFDETTIPHITFR